MPSSSMRLTNAASEKRGGGSVKCCDDSIACLLSDSPSDIAGKWRELVIVGRFVLAFLVEGEKAIELHDLARSAQVDVPRTRFGDNVDRGALEFGGFHLARDRAIPDQLVQARLVAIDIFGDFGGCAAGAGRAHRFVRLLRILRLVVILARRSGDVFLAVVAAQHGADVGNRLRRQVDAVCTHIGNQAGRFAVDLHAFVESLREPHGDRWGESELAAGFLLHGRGGEGRRRIAPCRLCFDRGHLEDGVLKIAGKGFRLGAGPDVEALDLLPVGADQARFEDFVTRGRQFGEDGPIFLRDEFLDFELAIADKPQRNRLHPSGGAGARQLAPEHRREGKAHEIIERTAGEICIDQCAINLAWMLHRFGHRLLGDGVEDHALDLLVLERLLFLQHLKHVPRDCFTFTIRVGGEDQLVGTLERPCDIVHALVRLGVDFPEHPEIVFRIDRAILGGQVTDMAKRGQDLIAGAEVFIDCLRLGRRLDYDNIHGNPEGYPPKPLRIRAESTVCSARNMGKVTPTVK